MSWYKDRYGTHGTLLFKLSMLFNMCRTEGMWNYHCIETGRIRGVITNFYEFSWPSFFVSSQIWWRKLYFTFDFSIILTSGNFTNFCCAEFNDNIQILSWTVIDKEQQKRNIKSKNFESYYNTIICFILNEKMKEHVLSMTAKL